MQEKKRGGRPMVLINWVSRSGGRCFKWQYSESANSSTTTQWFESFCLVLSEVKNSKRVKVMV